MRHRWAKWQIFAFSLYFDYPRSPQLDGAVPIALAIVRALVGMRSERGTAHIAVWSTFG